MSETPEDEDEDEELSTRTMISIRRRHRNPCGWIRGCGQKCKVSHSGRLIDNESSDWLITTNFPSSNRCQSTRRRVNFWRINTYLTLFRSPIRSTPPTNDHESLWTYSGKAKEPDHPTVIDSNGETLKGKGHSERKNCFTQRSSALIIKLRSDTQQKKNRREAIL